MDPKPNGEWSASEIKMARSLIARHNAGSSYGDETNKRHYAIVDELQARFPLKEKHQVIDLYVDLVVEMTTQSQNKSAAGTGDGSYQRAAVTSDVVNDNFGMPVEDPAMNNMVFLGSLTEKMGTTAMKTADEAPSYRAPRRQPERHTSGRFWTTEEHKRFLRGLRVYGRGHWKNISSHFVTTRTPVQVSSHAHKYFRRLENTAGRRRFSINDVGLYDAESWAQNNAPGWEALAFAGGAYNPNRYGSGGQLAAMNNLAQVWPPILYRAGQASSSRQVAAWAGGQQMGASSSAAPAMLGAGSQTAWTGDMQGDFLPGLWMNMNMY